MPVDITPADDLDSLKLEVGDKYRGILVDVDEAPHYKFGTQDPEFQRDGKPKTKWVARLRPLDAVDSSGDVKWWTQNQVKFTLRAALQEHPNNYLGAEVGIERLPDGEPKQKGYKGPADYRVVVIKPGPDGWTDPFTGVDGDGGYDDDEMPF